MTLPPPDWQFDCRKKCKCKEGINRGKFYTLAQPCPLGYNFDEEACDCPQPCGWCDDPSFAQDDPEGFGSCREESGKSAAGFKIEVTGYLRGYYRPWPLPRCCRTTFGFNPSLPGSTLGFGRVYPEPCPFDLEFFTDWQGPQLLIKMPCVLTPNPTKDDPCGDFDILYDYVDAGCDAKRLPENNPWEEGAFGNAWLIDKRYEPGESGYNLGRIFKPPGGSLVFNGSYWVGQVGLLVSCYYDD